MKRLVRLGPLVHLGLLVGVAGGFGFVPDAVAPVAGPAAILFHGPGLDAPVVLPVRAENITVLGATTPFRGSVQEAVSNRPAIAMALFWSPRWNEVAAAPAAARALDPDDAEQHGLYYPPVGGRPALISFGPHALSPLLRIVDPPSRALVEKYGLP